MDELYPFSSEIPSTETIKIPDNSYYDRTFLRKLKTAWSIREFVTLIHANKIDILRKKSFLLHKMKLIIAKKMAACTSHPTELWACGNIFSASYFIPEPRREAMYNIIPHGYLHPGKGKHSDA